MHVNPPRNVWWGWKNFYDEDLPTFGARVAPDEGTVAAAEASDDFRGGLAALELAKEFLDVLDFQSPLLKPVLLEEIFHGTITISRRGTFLIIPP